MGQKLQDPVLRFRIDVNGTLLLGTQFADDRFPGKRKGLSFPDVLTYGRPCFLIDKSPEFPDLRLRACEGCFVLIEAFPGFPEGQLFEKGHEDPRKNARVRKAFRLF